MEGRLEEDEPIMKNDFYRIYGCKSYEKGNTNMPEGLISAPKLIYQQ